MPNESTQTLRLDEHGLPTAELQRFVDVLVQNHEQHAMKAKVVELDANSRAHHSVLNLDATDTDPAEEDVIAARIFPRQECERTREELVQQLDSAVEHYANTIAFYAGVAYVFTVRAYLVSQAVLRQMASQARIVSATIRNSFEAYRAQKLSQSASVVFTGAYPAPQASDLAVVPVVVTSPTEYVIEHTEQEVPYGVHDTLVYSYEPQQAVVTPYVFDKAQEVETIAQAQNAYAHTNVQGGADDVVTARSVARSLYLNFKYGPKNLR